MRNALAAFSAALLETFGLAASAVALTIGADAQPGSDAFCFALIAAIFITLFGAMVMPALIVVTRPLHSLAARIARQVAWKAFKSALGRCARWIFAVVASGAALAILLAVSISPVAAGPVAQPAPILSAGADRLATAPAIERMIGILDKAAKHPVAQVAGLLARGYTAVKVYRLSKEMKGLKTDVGALHAAVHAILSDITVVIQRVDTGEVLTAAQIAEVNARIDVHAVRLAAVEVEIETLKARMDEAERRQRESNRKQRETDRRAHEHEKRTGRPSKVPFLFYDTTTGRHIDVRDRVGSGHPDARNEQR